MRKGILIFCCLSIYTNVLLAQYAGCDSLTIYNDHYIPFESKGIRTLDDLIRQKWPLMSKFISDRRALKSIPLWLNFNERLFFSDNNGIEISILIGTRKFSPDAVFLGDGQEISNIINYRDAPYGMAPVDSIISYISELKINSKEINKSIYDDLLNPNLFETVFSIRPIEIYKSDCGQFLYLYFFGKVDPAGDLPRFKFSYMAKLVFKIDGEYVGRIVERGETLEYFGFHNCPLFKGF